MTDVAVQIIVSGASGAIVTVAAGYFAMKLAAIKNGQDELHKTVDGRMEQMLDLMKSKGKSEAQAEMAQAALVLKASEPKAVPPT